MSNEEKPQLTLGKQAQQPNPPIPQPQTPTAAAPQARPQVQEPQVPQQANVTVRRERMRPTITDGTSSRFAVNPDRIPDDVEYRWVRIQIAGQDDQANYDRAVLGGLLEVPASRHPELVLPQLNQKERPDPEGPIVRSGHILMDLPKQVAIEKREQQRRDNIESIQSIEMNVVDGAPQTFFTDANKVTTSKGVSFQS